MDWTTTIKNIEIWIGQHIIPMALNLVLAILLLVVGFWIIRKVIKQISAILDKRNVDPTLKPFVKNILSISLKIALLISAAGIIGIKTTSFVAIIGAASLAIGLALQGTLANFAGGVLIILAKPFKVGDFIEGSGHSGTVHSISIINTRLITPQNEHIVIPNGALSNASIKNFSVENTRRADMIFGIGYSDDIDLTKTTLANIIDADSRVLQDPPPFIAVKELADSSVNLVVRVWVKKEDFWPVQFHMQETVKKTFDDNNISIPFPQRDIHVVEMVK